MSDPHDQLRSTRPSWWMLGASLIAMAALLMNSRHRHPAMMILPAILVLAYVVRFRLPGNAVLTWTIRAVLFGLILFTAPESQSVRYWYFDPASLATAGMMLEAELLIRHFLPLTRRKQLGEMLALTAGILMTGSSTTDQRFFAIAAPLYMLCALAVIRSFYPAIATSPALAPVQTIRTGRRWILHGTALLLALAIGYGISAIMLPAYHYMGGATIGMVINWLPQRSSGGISGDERLTSSWNPTSSTGRTLKITGTSHSMHLRGLAFDTYTQGQWRPTFKNRPLEDAGTFPDLPEGEGKPITVERLTDTLEILYLPMNTPGFQTPSGSTNLVEAGHRRTIQSVTETGETMVYTFILPPNESTQGPLTQPLSEEELAACLAVPTEIEPGVHELAKTLHYDDPRQQIMAVIRHLGDNHTYSLVSNFGGRDPISDFLLNKKSAHCQFFASAAAMLLRINGIPCRYVNGYFAHETTGDNSMVVRGRDAHAWVEAWVDGTGWVTVEATPANGTPEGLNEPVGWYQRLKDFVGDIIAAAGTLLLTAIILQAMKTWRSRRTRPRLRAYAFPRAEYQRLATEFEMLLKRLGDPPPGSSTWLEHLKSETAQHHRAARRAQFDAAMRFVVAYNRNRFGRPDDSDAIRELEQLLQEVKEK